MILQSGDGEFNQMVRVHVGYSLYPKPGYLAGYIGLNNRTNDFSDELHFGLEGGMALNKSLYAALKLNVVESLQNGDAAASQTGVFSNNIEYTGIGPEVTYLLDNGLGFSLGIFGAFSGQNILAAPSINVGIVYDLKKR